MSMSNTHDTQLFNLIMAEQERQKKTISLIASENYTSAAVRQATGSVLTNKYAEGTPGKRYYSGCEIVDEVERLAIERCKALFNAEHANVQPHAGSQANFAVYGSALNPGDLIMGMSLASGGHLTHGHSVNLSGTYYRTVQYGVHRDTHLLDYDEIETLAQLHRPKLIIAGASAYSRIIDFERFAHIAHSINALFLADIAHIAGLVAAHIHPSPLPYADFVSSTTHKTLRGPRGGFVLCKAAHAEKLDRAIMPGMQGGPLMNTIAAKAVAFFEAQQPSFVTYQQQVVRNAQTMANSFIERGYNVVTGGTDNHMLVLDLRNKGITGLQAEKALASIGITASRSCVPFDTEKPWITSGIRFGTPAITTRGAQEQDVMTLSYLIDEIFSNIQRLESEKFCRTLQQEAQRLVLPL